MLAIVTSINEPTTDLCVWSLRRNGFEVRVDNDRNSSLWRKLKWIYHHTDEDFLRVDADVIVNRNVTPQYLEEKKYIYDVSSSGPSAINAWWLQFRVYDWHKQDIVSGGVQFIRKEALAALRAHVGEFENGYRPETYLYRLEEFTKPTRRCVTVNVVAGLHGFAQNDIDRVKATKEQRGQLDDYDFELAGMLDQLVKS